eukprot:1140685-Pelagomonas_calceolata.AAC.4
MVCHARRATAASLVVAPGAAASALQTYTQCEGHTLCTVQRDDYRGFLSGWISWRGAGHGLHHPVCRRRALCCCSRTGSCDAVDTHNGVHSYVHFGELVAGKHTVQASWNQAPEQLPSQLAKECVLSSKLRGSSLHSFLYIPGELESGTGAAPFTAC